MPNPGTPPGACTTKVAPGKARFRPQGSAPVALRARDGQHNLPAERTSFVGREREMVEVERLLAMTRLLTLTGTGGSGKTRIALEIAGRVAGTYPDGAWLVELVMLSDPALVPQAVALALAVREQPDRPLEDTLVGSLEARRMLLVLDNCEHLIESAADGDASGFPSRAQGAGDQPGGLERRRRINMAGAAALDARPGAIHHGGKSRRVRVGAALSRTWQVSSA